MEIDFQTETHRGIDEVCSGVFTLSMYCGVFPISASSKELRTLKWSTVFTLVLTSLLISVASFYWEEHVSHVYLSDQDVMTRKLHFIPRLVLCLVPPVCNIWISCRTDKFLQLFRAILVLEQSISTISTDSSFSLYFLLSSNAILLLIAIYYGSLLSTYAIFIIYHVVMFFVILIILQFGTVLTKIRRHYQKLNMTLSSENAEMLTKCHELLGCCCALLCECYSPQLLLFTFSMYSLIVFQIYSMILNIRGGIHFVIAYFLMCVVFESYLVYSVLYNCQDAINKAKKFDKLLYHLVIEDESKALVRNKRIQIHFKGKRKEIFSAMGFFNLDFPLICKMVSSATAWIVILLQFS